MVPILSHTGSVLLPHFSRLESLRPPPWSVFHRPRRSRSAEGGAGAERGEVEGVAPRPHSEADALFRELELLGSLPAGLVLHFFIHNRSVC